MQTRMRIKMHKIRTTPSVRFMVSPKKKEAAVAIDCRRG